MESHGLLPERIKSLDTLYSNTIDIRMSLVALLNKDTRSAINPLKPLQYQALAKSATSDVFVPLKTGYGKSLIFQLLTHVCIMCTDCVPPGCASASASAEVY